MQFQNCISTWWKKTLLKCQTPRVRLDDIKNVMRLHLPRLVAGKIYCFKTLFVLSKNKIGPVSAYCRCRSGAGIFLVV